VKYFWLSGSKTHLIIQKQNLAFAPGAEETVEMACVQEA